MLYMNNNRMVWWIYIIWSYGRYDAGMKDERYSYELSQRGTEFVCYKIAISISKISVPIRVETLYYLLLLLLSINYILYILYLATITIQHTTGIGLSQQSIHEAEHIMSPIYPYTYLFTLYSL